MDTVPALDPLQAEDAWEVAGRRFRSRLIVGTGRYRSLEETAAAIAASGAEIVTVAVRRVNLSDPGAPMLQDFVPPDRYTYLPNTAGCHTAKDAVRTLRLAREAGGGTWSSWRCWARRPSSTRTCARPSRPPRRWSPTASR